MITPELVTPYLDNVADWQGKEYYVRCNAIREAMLPHSRGVYPERLENLNRPGETQEQKDYRRDIWKEISYPFYLQISSQEQKIRNVKGWNVAFPEDTPAIIRKGETLQEYINKDFPEHDNLDNYLFGKIRQANNEDANGVIAVYPIEYHNNLLLAEGQYLRPFPFIYSSEQVLYYKEGNYVVLLRKDKNIVKNGNDTFEGNIIVVIDAEQVGIFRQINQDSYESYIYNHNSGSLPVWKLGSHIQDEEIDGNDIFKSPLEAFRIPADEALMRYSDVQVTWNNHVHPEKVIIANTNCNDCNGNGKVQLAASRVLNRPQFTECRTCSGTGKQIQKVSALGAYVFSPATTRVDQQVQVPNSPVSYVEKPFEATRMLDENYRQLLQDGLTGLGLGYLNQTLLNVSGKKQN